MYLQQFPLKYVQTLRGLFYGACRPWRVSRLEYMDIRPHKKCPREVFAVSSAEIADVFVNKEIPMRLHRMILGIGITLISTISYAQTLQCPGGTQFVNIGDTIMQVISKCGAPMKTVRE